jgi:hypothetical protein
LTGSGEGHSHPLPSITLRLKWRGVRHGPNLVDLWMDSIPIKGKIYLPRWNQVMQRIMVVSLKMRLASNMSTVMIHGNKSTSHMILNYKILLECWNQILCGINSPQRCSYLIYIGSSMFYKIL